MAVEDLILKLAHATRAIARTHMHWHLSENQETVLRDLDELIQVLENPVVETAPTDVSLEKTNA